MPEETLLSDLLAIPVAERTSDWLERALQLAARIEFATIPPYLCALWSIKSGEGRAYDHLREVVIEEMLHLGLVNNLLTTLGFTPKLFPDAAARYPCGLPGGLRPDLVVPIRGLTIEGIRTVFMEIEKPHHDISGVDPIPEPDATLGDFYTAILNAFEAIPGTALSGHRQLARILTIRPGVRASLFKIESHDDVRRAINTIKEQGEGTATSPFDMSKGLTMDLAHYFRFAELEQGRELEFDGDGNIRFTGAPIPFPETYPVADVPAGGYPPSSTPAAVTQKLDEFDAAYTEMVRLLQSAWESSPSDPLQGQPAKLSASMGAMFNLTALAAEIMRIEIAPGGPVYGPRFQLIG